MCKYIEEEQNKKIDEILNEGLSNFEENIFFRKKKFTNDKNNNRNYFRTCAGKKNNFLDYDNNNNFFKNIKSNQKPQIIYYDGKSSNLIKSTIEALNIGLYKPNKNKKLKSKRRNIKGNLIQKYKSFNKLNSIFFIENEKNNSIIDNNIKKFSTQNLNNKITYDNIIEDTKISDEEDETKIKSKNLVKTKKPKKIYKNFEYKEKYNKVKKEYKNIKTQLKKVQKSNKKLDERIKKFNYKLAHQNEIKDEAVKIQDYNDELRQKNIYSENIRIKQLKLIEKLSREISELKKKNNIY